MKKTSNEVFFLYVLRMNLIQNHKTGSLLLFIILITAGAGKMNKVRATYMMWEDRKIFITYYDSLKYGYASRNGYLYKFVEKGLGFSCYKLDNYRKYTDSWYLNSRDTLYYYTNLGGWPEEDTTKYMITKILSLPH